jgi:uncharacterized protein (DUF1810 family)
MNEPIDLSRFHSAQEEIYETALAELKSGEKRTHWMWFVFPQIAGLGSSPTAKFYAVKSLAEAKAYLADPVLGARLAECCEALLAVTGKSATRILGQPDDLKLKSSMTLFAAAKGEAGVFDRVLNAYFAGNADEKTLQILRNQPA